MFLTVCNTVCNPLTVSSLLTILQKVAFCSLKDGKPHAKRWPFAMRKATFCHAASIRRRNEACFFVSCQISTCKPEGMLPFGYNMQIIL